MQTINVYEFKDLSKDIQKSVYNKVLNEIVNSQLELLNYELLKENITEQQYYNFLGYSKYYAESTAWFIPSCYYQKNKSDINIQVKNDLNFSLFNELGQFIQYKI